MQFTKLEHIGIAVKDLSKSIMLFETLSGKKLYKTEEVPLEQVKTAFFKTGDTKIEFLEATHEDSAIRKFIDKRGEGLHHIAFEVKNIKEAMKEVAQKGFTLLRDEPKVGADNKLICFIHPKDTHGILIELCQEITADHIE